MRELWFLKKIQVKGQEPPSNEHWGQSLRGRGLLLSPALHPHQEDPGGCGCVSGAPAEVTLS